MIDLREIIAKYDPSNNDYRAILYVGLERGLGKLGEAEDVKKVTKAVKAVGKIFVSGIGGEFFAGAVDGGFSNVFAIMTVNDDFLCFYTFKKLTVKIENIANINGKVVLPYDAIVKAKISKTLLGNNFKLYYSDGKKTHKLKVVTSGNTPGISGQKENVEILSEYIKNKNLLTV